MSPRNASAQRLAQEGAVIKTISGGEIKVMSQRGFILYPNIKCPYCKWNTTSPESLGVHLVDKHGDKVIKGVHKVRTGQKPRRAVEVTA